MPGCDRILSFGESEIRTESWQNFAIERTHSCPEMEREEGWTDPRRAIRPLTDLTDSFHELFQRSTELQRSCCSVLRGVKCRMNCSNQRGPSAVSSSKAWLCANLDPDRQRLKPRSIPSQSFASQMHPAPPACFFPCIRCKSLQQGCWPRGFSRPIRPICGHANERPAHSGPPDGTELPRGGNPEVCDTVARCVLVPILTRYDTRLLSGLCYGPTMTSCLTSDGNSVRRGLGR